MNRTQDERQVIRHEFQLLKQVPGLVHGVFTRHGGVSRPPYAALNVAFNNGDSFEAVCENLSRVKDALRISQLVAGIQVHGDTVHLVDDEALRSAKNRYPVVLTPPGDALVTNLKGTGLLIKIADCQAVFLVDPVREVIANVHCGWRGSVNGLLLKVVRLLNTRYGCRPEDLLAAVGPSLGPCCAEFRNYRRELPPSFLAFQTKPEYFDFWAISRGQLINAGLLSEHIEVAERCTVCESRHFFSYRGEGTTGRMAAVLSWKG